MKSIICTDRNGNSSEYYYYLEPTSLEGKQGYLIRIFSVANFNYGKYFNIEIYHVSNSEIKIKLIHNYGEEFSAKGIPDSVIPELSKLFFTDIISSSNNKSHQQFTDEGRTSNADKYWKRLVDKGVASFEKEADIFRFKRLIPESVI